MTKEHTDTMDGEQSESRTTMGSIEHTHPETNGTFGAVFRRGPVVAADGGERDAEEETDETMEDIDHEAPDEGVTRAYERGTEGRDETV
ncbi:hypothetical protein HISP_05500 [Haloarcula hispanica N601]|uniref:Uncharacterized protein n=3 Tax=Haloarcula hispanica TaxID=51589 RepID=V5TLR7_HALHI|nr:MULTISPECIES: hypothetical protein [Haloarcula]AHB65489.1 hypothetical protein HISP_05500 [Haloarcula hispanica N601]AJF26614.1 hypothetical protein SG26_13165 [Haloarcula sp. CBA1115]KAA9407563.1 hypothetical protein Har1131_12350 [Haloarcula sp. CBA1131]KAA9409398.1 hypothetical protein EGO51_06170 [Haloarcula hispanica]KZX47790.1 hypothetical protein AV929_14025 [Haloarcula sp. K1]